MESSKTFLKTEQVLEKFPCLSKNTLKNILNKNISGFREKVTSRVGRRLIFNEEALIRFLSDSKGE